MPADDPAYVMLDANALMHFRRPDQIDWLTMLKCKSVNLVVTPTLLRELEGQKVKNWSRKLRDRADNAVTWIAKFFESEKPPELRNGVFFKFIRHSPQLDFSKHRLSEAVYDDELIASAIELREELGCEVRFFTADTGLRLKLSAHGFRSIVPSDDLKLPNEPDEVEKENATLKKELSRHLDRLPNLKFTFLEGGNSFALKSIREGVDAIRPEAPPQFGTSQREYDNYVAKLAKWKKASRLTTGFRVRLDNAGSAVASNIRIEIALPDFVRAVRPQSKPEVPTIMSSRNFHTNLVPSNEEEPIYADNQASVAFSINNLVHNRVFDSELVFIGFKDENLIQGFSSEYLITCVENADPIRGTMQFTLNENWKNPADD